MKIFYGYDDKHYINVTSVIFEKCFQHNQLVIPAGDEERRKIIGFDPYPNILKHILIVDYQKNHYIFRHHQPCTLSFQSIIEQLQATQPKHWWNMTGKFIQDPKERLSALHQHLQFDHGKIGDELPEQLLAIQFVPSNATVLEIGGNIGRNSLVLSTILDQPSHHVVLESNPTIVPLLRHNLQLNHYETQVEPSALSYTKLIQKEWNTIPASQATDAHRDWIPVSTITFEEIEQKYNLQFDTLIADCEGALFYILKDNPDILNHINLVIMENDYWDMDEKQMVDAILSLKGFTRTHHVPGGWGPCYDFFYEVWTK